MRTRGLFFLLRFAVGAYVKPYVLLSRFAFLGRGIHMLQYVAPSYMIVSLRAARTHTLQFMARALQPLFRF